jgi:hypothetical protein
LKSYKSTPHFVIDDGGTDRLTCGLGRDWSFKGTHANLTDPQPGGHVNGSWHANSAWLRLSLPNGPASSAGVISPCVRPSGAVQ